jgi:hypothetical protein
MGGLGNQLFQIFAAFAYAIQYKCRLILPYDEVLTTGISRPTYWGNFLNSLSIFTTANPANGLSNSELFESCNHYQWHHHHYSPIPFSSDNLLLYGYFQSPKYFQEYESQIFRIMRIKEIQEKIKQDYSQYFSNESKYKISMHFRLGDYKENPYHPVLSYNYYLNALNMICSLTEIEIQVLYFCEKEDNQIVNETIEKLKLVHNIEFIKVDDEISDWKQMMIMSLCDINIIANSSFSWWGAYFGKKDRIICYPDKWFDGQLESNYTGDMFPDCWIKIIA